MFLKPFCRVLISWLVVVSSQAMADEPASQKAAERIKEIAGTAEFLRSVPKHFAILKSVDVANHRVTLLIDKETVAKVWPLMPDAEVKIAGWWGRLDQLSIGDRVWVWFKTDRKKQPVAISMLADEVCEQDIHDVNVTVIARDTKTITLKGKQGPLATQSKLQTAKSEVYRGAAKSALENLKIGEKVYVQTSGDGARLILDQAAFEARRSARKGTLRQRWLDQGLPGTVTFLHVFSGEMDFMLDHEAMRWGRSLKLGDKVTLQAEPPIQAVVRHVRPWRERTEVRLVVNGVDQADLAVGQRMHLKMPAPSPEVENSSLPPDLGQRRDKNERIEWFLASIYCTCGIAGDTCTGHFYTLASCNPNGCGMPNHMREALAKKIDKGLSDKQIFEELLKEQGPGLLRQHLLP